MFGYTGSELAALEKLNFFSANGKGFTGKEFLFLNSKPKKSVKANKADRIEFYALQVSADQPIEFQPDERLLNNRRINFLKNYSRITGEDV